MTTAVHVVKALPEHADVMTRLHATSFPAPWAEEDFEQFLIQPGMLSWIAGHDESAEPTGFILMRRVADEAEVLTIAVDPAARKRGVGRALLDHALEILRARGVASVFLEVAVNNKAAQALYRATGFVACGTRRNYYEHGEDGGDATVMRRDL